MTIYATAVRCGTHPDCWNALAEDLEKGSGIMHDYRLVHSTRENAQRIAAKMGERMTARYAPATDGVIRCIECRRQFYPVPAERRICASCKGDYP